MTKGDLIRTELGIALFALFPAALYAVVDGLADALGAYALCVGVPQPFLLIPYARERRRRRRYRTGRL